MAAPTERQFQPLPVPIGAARAISAPFQFVTTGEDNLRVTVINSLIGCRVAVQGRRIDDQGTILPIAHAVTPTSDRAAVSAIFPLGVGAIVNLTVWASEGTPKIGQTFVIVQLVRGREGGTELLGTLLSGYVTAVQALGWPGSPIQSSIEGPGYIRQITGTIPAAGAEIFEIVPTGARWELLAVTLAFVPGVAAADRRVLLYADPSYAAVFYAPCATPINFPFVLAVNWCSGLGATPTGITPFQAMPLPVSMPLLAQTVITTYTEGMQPTDQYQQVHYTVREWLEVS